MGLERAARLLPLHGPGSLLAVHLFAFVCLLCLCVPFTCAAAALSHSSLHPCPPLHSPISQLQAPIFQPGAGEAAQRGQTSSPPTLPRCLPCSALCPPFCISRWPGRQGSYKRMGEVGLSTASLRAHLLPTQSQALSPRRTQSRSGPWPFEPPERDLYLSPPPPRPSLQEDYSSETHSGGASAEAALRASPGCGLCVPCVCPHVHTLLLPRLLPAPVFESVGRGRPRVLGSLLERDS